MSILNSIKVRVKSALETSSWSFFGSLGAFRTTDLVSNKSDSQLFSYYRSWNKVAVDAISRNVATIKFVLKDRNGNEVTSHPVLDIVKSPCSALTTDEFYERIESYRLLVGRAPVYIKKIGNDFDLIPLPPAEFEALTDDKGAVVKYRLSSGNSTIDYKIEEIIPFRTFHPTDLHKGFPATRASLYTIETMIELENWEYNFYKRGAIPPFAIVYKQSLTRPQMDAVRKKFKKTYSGSNNAFEPMILSGNDGVDIKKTGLNPKELSLSEAEIKIRNKILGQYGVPLVVAGIVEDVNLNNAESSVRVFLRNNIEPRHKNIVSFFQKFLIDRYFKSEGLVLEYRDPVPEDLRLKIETYVKAAGNKQILSQNEAREAIGREPLDDERADEINGEMPVMTPQTETTPEDEEKPKKQSPIKVEKIAKIPSSKKALVKLLNKRTVELENRIGKRLEKYFKGLSERVANSLMGVSSAKEFKSLPEESFNYAQETALLTAVLGEGYEDIISEALSELSAEIGEIVDPSPALVQRILSSILEKSVLQINDTTRKEIQESLYEGIQKGEGIVDLQDRVKAVIKEMSETRSYSIAQTETTKVMGMTHQDGMERMNVKKKEWYDTGDGRVRDSHRKAHGQVVDIKEHFKVGNSLLYFPGDPNGSAQDVINCRCRSLPVVDD